jgi:CelD/BcsL family acetyltransferase involved in cellulose biosynthesis
VRSCEPGWATGRKLRSARSLVKRDQSRRAPLLVKARKAPASGRFPPISSTNRAVNVISPVVEDLEFLSGVELAGVGSGAGVRLGTFASFGEAREIVGEWDALVAGLGGSLYMTFAWCEVWWRHYGAGRELRVFAVRSGGELVGVFPFFIDRLATPLGRARVAKLVGSDSTLAVMEPLVEPGLAVEAFGLAFRQLFEADRVDMVHVGPCSGVAAHVGAVRAAASKLDAGRVVRDREAGSHTVFDMSDGFDGYLAGLSSHQRSNYRRKLKKLNGSFKLDLDVVREGPALEREFEAFMEMHQAQWKAVNKLGHFDDWPGSREYSWDLVRSLVASDRVRLVRLLADDRVVAYYWCFALGGTYYWRLSARLFGQEWDQFALGRVGVVKMMELANSDHATAIEAGIGSYGYKENLNAKTHPLHAIAIRRNGLLSHLRAAFTLAYGDFLNLAYYRVWYLRVAPHAKLLQRPLWRSWSHRRF